MCLCWWIQVPYLVNVKGFSERAVTSSIFPVFTYSDFAFTLLAAPLSQALGCKPAIVVGSAARVGTRLLLLYGTSLRSMQVMQVPFPASRAIRRAAPPSSTPPPPPAGAVRLRRRLRGDLLRLRLCVCGPGALPGHQQPHPGGRPARLPARGRGRPAGPGRRRLAHLTVLRLADHRLGGGRHLARAAGAAAGRRPHRRAGRGWPGDGGAAALRGGGGAGGAAPHAGARCGCAGGRRPAWVAAVGGGPAPLLLHPGAAAARLVVGVWQPDWELHRKLRDQPV